MLLNIKNRVEKELRAYTRAIDRLYSLNKLSPILFKSIKEFILGGGKRVRPILFCIGYLGFSKKTPPGLYRSALSLELLHDFLLVHDDIIDKSSMRRGKPSMHTRLKRCLFGNKKAKFSGEDLAIVAGDVMYAMGLDAFLAVKEDPLRKEAALRKLIQAVLYTASGEFIELLMGIKPIEKGLADMRNIPAMKLPMVFCDAKPTAAPPMAETDKIQSELNPLTRLIATTAPINTKILKKSARLFATFASKFARFAKCDKYLVTILSTTIAINAMTAISIIILNDTPSTPGDG